jgi:hypothetical protein
MVERGSDSLPEKVRQSANWVSNYASDVWHNPGEHMTEIAAGVGSAALLASLAIPEVRAGVYAAKELLFAGLGNGGAAAAERSLSGRGIRDALGAIEKLGFKSNGSASYATGKLLPDGTRVLDFSEPITLQASKFGAQPTLAHQLEIPADKGGFTARYFRDQSHAQRYTLPGEKPEWPLNSLGPLDNLEQAGIHNGFNSSRVFSYTNKLDRLDITAGEPGKRLSFALDNIIHGHATDATPGINGLHVTADALTIEGNQAAVHGTGLMTLRNISSGVRQAELYGYPEIPQGGNLRIYFDSLGSSSIPRHADGARYIALTRGLEPSRIWQDIRTNVWGPLDRAA